MSTTPPEKPCNATVILTVGEVLRLYESRDGLDPPGIETVSGGLTEGIAELRLADDQVLQAMADDLEATTGLEILDKGFCSQRLPEGGECPRTDCQNRLDPLTGA